VPRLILLNGPPGIGKSTLAQRYVEDHPLALNLDIDTVRCLLGRWIDHQERAGWMARALALHMARVHLVDGHDVVVPQLLGRPPFIEQLEQLAEAVPATFFEIVLLDSKELALERFSARRVQPTLPGRFNPHEVLDRIGGMTAVDALYDRLMDLLAMRPEAVIIETKAGDVDGSYAELLRRVEGEG